MDSKQEDTPEGAEAPAKGGLLAEGTVSPDAPKDDAADSPGTSKTESKPLDTLPNVPSPHRRTFSRRKLLVVAAVVVLVAIGVSAFMIVRGGRQGDDAANNQTNTQSQVKKTATTPPASKVEGLQLDPNKNYGDKYANGLLPVGDKQYSSAKAEKGKVYLCNANFVAEGQAGAQSRGPWFVGTTQWDVNKKVAVGGSVDWTEKMSNTISGSSRMISTNGLPNHPTGTFPVASGDPAYQYDRNPNTIKEQSLTYTLAASPTYGTPQCMGGESGIMLTGAALFNGFDAGGRDAGAWEVQDSCQGHPQSAGEYHYHSLSSCIKDVSVSKVIGFALDGFPITGPNLGPKNYLTTSDLDECHGIVSEITLDGKKVTSYHYVMTEDFPYSVSCFRSKAIQPPGQAEGRPPAGGNQHTGLPPA